MGEWLLNVHDSYRIVVAVCDKELYGTKIDEGNKQLDLTGEFFKGEEVNEETLREEVERCLAEDANFNLIGEKTVAFFKELGLVKDEGIMTVKGIPYALVLL